MRQFAGQSDGFLAVRRGLLGMAQMPEQMGQISAAEDAEIRAGEERQSGIGRAAVCR